MIDLYPCFAHLKKFNTIYLYSDPHFNDEEMKYIRKNYISDDEQVKHINSKVGKKDILIILGDIGDVSFINKLRGYKILVMGNHDKGKTNYQKTAENNLFDEIYSGILTLNDKIVLSHEPVFIPFMYNIHGHDHANIEANDDLHLNVCAEHIDYTPVSLSEIIKSGKLKDIQSIHRITIDKATERKVKKNKNSN